MSWSFRKKLVKVNLRCLVSRDIIKVSRRNNPNRNTWSLCSRRKKKAVGKGKTRILVDKKKYKSSAKVAPETLQFSSKKRTSTQNIQPNKEHTFNPKAIGKTKGVTINLSKKKFTKKVSTKKKKPSKNRVMES